MDWCGGDKFDGCLIFDECHKAKNFVPVGDSRHNIKLIMYNTKLSYIPIKFDAISLKGKEENSTKVALAVTTIQR